MSNNPARTKYLEKLAEELEEKKRHQTQQEWRNIWYGETVNGVEGVHVLHDGERKLLQDFVQQLLRDDEVKYVLQGRYLTTHALNIQYGAEKLDVFNTLRLYYNASAPILDAGFVVNADERAKRAITTIVETVARYRGMPDEVKTKYQAWQENDREYRDATQDPDSDEEWLDLLFGYVKDSWDSYQLEESKLKQIESDLGIAKTQTPLPKLEKGTGR